MVITGQEGNAVSISFEMGIYKDGFNGKVLKVAVNDFAEVMDDVQRLLK